MKTLMLHPQEKQTAVFHFFEQQERHLLTQGASIKYSAIIHRALVFLSLLRSDAPKPEPPPRWKKNKISYNNPCATPPRADLQTCISLFVSVVISASQVWIPFFLNPPPMGLGVGRQESNTPLSPSPLKAGGGKKYGALCCVQCRLINFIS